MKNRSWCEVVLLDCLGLKPSETVGIVSDHKTEAVASLLHQKALTLAAESVWVQMKERANNGIEPPDAVAAFMKEVDVLILATTQSLSHTKARIRANEAKTRVASMPGITLAMAQRALAGSYEDLSLQGDTLKRILDAGSWVQLKSPSGTDLQFSIQGRRAANDDGNLSQPGAFGNLPAGEAYIAPVEKTAEGLLVVDASMAGVGLLVEPLRIEIHDGMAQKITGGAQAESLQQILQTYGEASRNVAELGIGTNPYAIITGAVLEDEKVKHTVHVALGDNATIGGTVVADSHLDGIVLSPTLLVDGVTIMQDGEFVLRSR